MSATGYFQKYDQDGFYAEASIYVHPSDDAVSVTEADLADTLNQALRYAVSKAAKNDESSS